MHGAGLSFKVQCLPKDTCGQMNMGIKCQSRLNGQFKPHNILVRHHLIVFFARLQFVIEQCYSSFKLALMLVRKTESNCYLNGFCFVYNG